MLDLDDAMNLIFLPFLKLLVCAISTW